MFQFKSKPSIKITSPCNANLSKMSTTEKGKFCSLCQKEVVSFSMMSESEIISFFENYSGNKEVCGSFSKNQMDFDFKKETHQIFTQKQKLTKKLSMFVFLLMTTLRIFGQGVPQIAGGIRPIDPKELNANQNDSSSQKKAVVCNSKPSKKAVKRKQKNMRKKK